MALTGSLADRVPQQHARVTADLGVVVGIARRSRHYAEIMEDGMG